VAAAVVAGTTATAKDDRASRRKQEGLAGIRLFSRSFGVVN